MKCPECKEQLVDYVEGTSGGEATQIEAHLEQCAVCRAELEELRSLHTRLKRPLQSVHKTSLEARVMDRIITQQAAELRRLRMRKRIQLFGAGAAGLAAACAVLFVLLSPTQDQRAWAAEVMAKAATQAAGLKTVHLKCRMRTLPGDNFSLVGADREFVQIDVWKQLGQPAKYRIEKPGRVLVCDGESTVMLIKPDHAVKGPAGANFDAAWLRDLADVETVLSEQLRESLALQGDMSITHETVEGKQKLLITVEVKAAGSGDYMHNKFLMTSDTRRVFQFDAATKRLEAMKIILQAKPKDTLVFEVTAIEYDPELAPSLFKLELPKEVVWYTQPVALPDNEKYSAMTPKQVAEAFFGACTKKDWDEAQKFWPAKIDDRLKAALGGMKVVSFGKPFQSKPYGGWFVPYEIELMNSGHTRKHNLAIRNDNPAKRWIVDGGL